MPVRLHTNMRANDAPETPAHFPSTGKFALTAPPWADTRRGRSPALLILALFLPQAMSWLHPTPPLLGKVSCQRGLLPARGLFPEQGACARGRKGACARGRKCVTWPLSPRCVQLRALRSAEEELPIDDGREIEGDEDEDETTAAARDSDDAGVDGMYSMEEAQVFDSSSIQVLEEVTWVPNKMGIVGQWLQTLSEGSKEPLYTVPAPTGSLLRVCLK